MYLCKVTGTIVSSKKDEHFRDGKLLIVHPVDGIGDLDGEKDMLAIDPGYGAGLGDVVLVARRRCCGSAADEKRRRASQCGHTRCCRQLVIRGLIEVTSSGMPEISIFE